MAQMIKYYENSTTFEVVKNERETVRFELPLIGKFNVYNALAAIIALHDRGLELAEIAKLLKRVNVPEGRMERIETHDSRRVFIDYAHTPDGIEKALDSIKLFVKGKLICLIGTGGDRDITKRPLMAQKASESANYVVITTDNPRYESNESIMAGLASGMIHTNYICLGDRKEAIHHAIKMAGEDDIVILAGKGHEKYQIVRNERIPFDEKEIAQEAIKKYPL
jgi:UDP-N-acetylmuramyl-tripeptide synthetase